MGESVQGVQPGGVFTFVVSSSYHGEVTGGRRSYSGGYLELDKVILEVIWSVQRYVRDVRSSIGGLPEMSQTISRR
jgi:hypothetical protein